jgi:hypothetical protein
MSTRKTAAALGATFAVTLAAGTAVAANPFQMVEFGNATTVAAKGCDMEGNCFETLDSFTYGGDAMGGYAGGKVGTGAKDPSVCGTFGGASCSMPHLQK